MAIFWIEEAVMSKHTRTFAPPVRCQRCGVGTRITFYREHRFMCPACDRELDKLAAEGRGTETWVQSAAAGVALAFVVFFLWLFAATAGAHAQDLSRPECAGFNPYQWTDAQIAACLGFTPGTGPVPVFLPSDTTPQDSGRYPDWRGKPVKVQAFANVLVGVVGEDNDYGAYVVLENDTEPNTAHIIVRGGVAEIHKVVHLDPGQRKVEKLNEWTVLVPQLPIGVSVRVEWQREGNAGVAMHRARDYGAMVQAQEGGGGR